MHVTLRILALLAFLAVASLGIPPAHRAGSLEHERASQIPETEHMGCLSRSLCGLNTYRAGDLYFVEPSFG
jgi:hypothetical protein